MIALTRSNNVYSWVAKIQYTEKFGCLLYSQTHPEFCRTNMVGQVMKRFTNGCISIHGESVRDSHTTCILFSLLSLSSACIATSKSHLQVQVISVFLFFRLNASFAAYSLFAMQKLTCVVLNTHTQYMSDISSFFLRLISLFLYTTNIGCFYIA